MKVLRTSVIATVLFSHKSNFLIPSSALVRRMMTTHSEPFDCSNAITELYNVVPRCVFSLCVTGGGVSALPWFLTVPGSSSSVLHAEIPYSRAALIALLSSTLNSTKQHNGSCSTNTAIDMAKASYLKSVSIILKSAMDGDIEVKGSNLFGVSCTAALVSTVPKKGPHRCHVSIYSQQYSVVYSLDFEKGKRDRTGEDNICSKLIVDSILAHCGVRALPNSLCLNSSNTLLLPGEEVVEQKVVHGNILDRVYSCDVSHAVFFKRNNSDQPNCSKHINASNLDEQFTYFESAQLPAGTIIYPGSFNPLHVGHLSLVKSELNRLLKQAKQESFATVAPLVVFEIAAVNADKPPLPRDELLQRMLQFDTSLNPLFKEIGLTNIAVCVTREPLFVDKARMFPNCSFLIGADTMSRLLDKKYYREHSHDSSADSKLHMTEPLTTNDLALSNMISALTKIASYNCKFIVGGRVKPSPPVQQCVDTSILGIRTINKAVSEFETCDVILKRSNERIGQLPSHVRALFLGLTEEEFRLDLSSTELRKQQQQSGARKLL